MEVLAARQLLTFESRSDRRACLGYIYILGNVIRAAREGGWAGQWAAADRSSLFRRRSVMRHPRARGASRTFPGSGGFSGPISHQTSIRIARIGQSVLQYCLITCFPTSSRQAYTGKVIWLHLSTRSKGLENASMSYFSSQFQIFVLSSYYRKVSCSIVTIVSSADFQSYTLIPAFVHIN